MSAVAGGIGDTVARPDGMAKVAGAFVFANDLAVPGMLHGAILRAPHPRARILRVDVSAARALPGVAAVVTAGDVPGIPTYGLLVADQPVFASDLVQYAGEPVAAVAAEHPDAARAALAAIVVEYEVLEPQLDPEIAVAGLRPPIHAGGDVSRHQLIVAGDPDIEGEVVVEGTYEVAMQDQAPLGTEAALALPAADGLGVEVIAGTQSLHDDRRQIAACLGVPLERVRCTGAGTGGAFGSREDLHVQIPTALLALRTGRPVRTVLSRADSFVGHPHRHPARIHMRHHADRDGHLVKIEARIVLDGGAHTSTSPAVLFNAVSHAQGPYRCPNVRIDGWAVRTNNPPGGAMRGFGVPQVCFAHESQMDRLAAACGLDPIEVRLRNALGPGDVLATGQVVTAPAPVAECLRATAALPMPPPAPADPRAKPGGPGLAADGAEVVRGVGYGVAFKNLMYSEGFDDAVSVRARLADGVVTLEIATCEAGQGFVTVAEQVVRSVLGDVRVALQAPDTTGGSAGSTSASRTVWMAGGAIQAACRAIRERRDAGAAEPIEVEVEHHHRTTEPVDASGHGDAHVAFAYVAHRAVVDVDVGLGLVKVVQVATAQDVGVVVDPLGVIGQIEGGIVQGVGLAIMERLHVDGGTIRNRSFADYLVPTALDAPDIVVHLLEEPEPTSPLGAKGAGEPPCISVTPAVVAAIRDATGRALTRVPVRPDDLVL